MRRFNTPAFFFWMAPNSISAIWKERSYVVTQLSGFHPWSEQKNMSGFPSIGGSSSLLCIDESVNHKYRHCYTIPFFNVASTVLTLSLLRVINVKIPLQPHKNMTSHSMENLTFHSLLRWKVIILQTLATSLIQSLFERLGEYTFWSQAWKG